MSRSVARGIVLIALAVVVIAGLLVIPSKRGPKQRPSNDDPWVLVNYNPDDPYGTYLGNGFISTRIMGDGVGSQNGQPLPCYMAGFYDNEKLIPIPTWSDLRFYDGTDLVRRNVKPLMSPDGKAGESFRFGEQQFKLDREAPYIQKLDTMGGVLTTKATWRRGNKSLTGTVEVFASRARPNLGVMRVDLVPNFAGNVVPQAPLGSIPSSLSRTRSPEIGVAVFRRGKSQEFVAFDSCVIRDGESVPVFLTSKHGAPILPGMRVSKNRPLRFIYFVSVGTGDSAEAAVREEARGLWGPLAGEIDFVKEHRSAWARLWRNDITIDGPRKDQQIIHSCMFYLLQSVRKGSRWSIPPMGLSNNAFSGHVFWDADIWMFPALILQHPELAKSIVEYRYETLPGAIANAKAAGMPGAQYAWESGATGKEDTPGGLVYQHERHINGDVALAQWQYYLATGDLNWLKTRGYPVIKATADWWAAKAKFVPAKGRYEILQVCPPDENAELVNNSAYTNAIAQMNLEIATRTAKLTDQRADLKWAEVASKLYVPFDAKSRRFIAFDGDGNSRFGPRYKAKQADVELLAYPLQYQIPGQSMPDIYENTLAHYAPRVHSRGPAMTSSAYSVISARLGGCAKAYSEFTRSYKPFLRGPFNYFNEKPSKMLDNMCFLTGAAGPIQAAVFGFAGARVDYFAGQPDLVFKPCLPKQWKSLKLTNIHWLGKTFDMEITPTGAMKTAPRSRTGP